MGRFWENRQPQILEAIDKMDAEDARAALRSVVENIVTDNAGLLAYPFVYLSRKDWMPIEERIVGASRSGSPR